MKRNLLDKVIGYFSPEAELRRLTSRGKTEYRLRSYDAAKTFKTDDWVSATAGSANSEINGAQSIIRDKGRDAIRNNPYAGRGLNAIVSNTVGSGILPHIKGKTENQVRQLNLAWKEWGETTLCDANNNLNFYNMQSLAMRAAVEGGESLVIKEITKDGPKLKLIESDFIATTKETKNNNIEDTVFQGIRIDKNGTVKSYFLYNQHPGDYGATTYQEMDANKICHIFKRDRPGQLRGVSWFHPVIRQLEDFNQFQEATLISRKVAACYSAFVTTNDADSTLSNSDLIAKREAESMLSPGSIRYLGQGENITLATPPAVAGYDEYCRQTLRGIAGGLGITYEALTSDYSQVNFSSGRMGHLEFRRNVEMWRWGMIIPQFCEPAFQHFLLWANLVKGINIDGASCEFVPPAWNMIDPNKEISAIQAAIRAGLTTLPKAIKEQGYDPSDLLKEINESNAKLDELGIILDSDPRKVTGAGIFQIDPSTYASGTTNTDDSGQGVQ